MVGMRTRRVTDGPVRRSVLTGAVGAAGLAVLALTGCGIRLDRDPALPELTPSDLLRDAVARALAAIRPTEDAGVRAAVDAFAEAVGPPWNPPEDLASPVPAPHTDPPPVDAAAGLADVAGQVIAGVVGLGATTDATAAVLADVTAGALLHLDALDAEAAVTLRTDLAEAQRTVLARLEGRGDGARADGSSAPPTGAGAQDAAGTDDADGARVTSPGAAGAGDHGADGEDGAGTAEPLAALLTACASTQYAYERALVHLDPEDPAQAGGAARLRRLQGIIAAGPLLDPALSVPHDRPAWGLPVDPRDAATAREALQAAEDSVAAGLLAARAALPPAALLAWLDDSARARSRAAGPQDLRFEVAAPTQENDA